MEYGDIEQSPEASFKRGSFYLPELKRCYVTYKDADEVYVSTGFGTCKDKYFEITTQIEHTMTSLASAFDWHYIYVDYDASSFPTATVIDSTTEPAWSDTYQNYYNGDDLCLGSVPSTDGAATLIESGGVGKGKISFAYWTLLSGGNPDSSWQELDVSTYVPTNASGVFVGVNNTDSGAGLTAQVGVGNSTSDVRVNAVVGGSAYQEAGFRGWLSIPLAWTGNLYWYGQDNDDSNFGIYIYGYENYRP